MSDNKASTFVLKAGTSVHIEGTLVRFPADTTIESSHPGNDETLAKLCAGTRGVAGAVGAAAPDVNAEQFKILHEGLAKQADATAAMAGKLDSVLFSLARVSGAGQASGFTGTAKTPDQKPPDANPDVAKAQSAAAAANKN